MAKKGHHTFSWMKHTFWEKLATFWKLSNILKRGGILNRRKISVKSIDGFGGMDGPVYDPRCQKVVRAPVY